MYDAVLLPTDGSEGTRAAVEHAIDHANRYDAALHVLYVVDARIGGARETTPEIVFAELEEQGRQAIEGVQSQARGADVGTIEGVVARGDPHQAILDYVTAEDIDLVVMGTHGRTGLDHYLIGSVTEKVVRLSDVPVLTVPLPDP
ncbi:universal stress protein [Haloarcula salinisoli]|uniref:Universal stress protein n=1 Tax=Haloarcula salinisoli TaxID=2487746 RepID=A0A8J7YH29_9EURY|nr:universal stress protein [Halomicroarcula salinisoli]MBX0285219.1 universal stress protein [Halomicroarcula salinisoli]MBX0303303.1 universal stress protein [Halomicroarcula salinisoli]